jgi:hypothetical protein
MTARVFVDARVLVCAATGAGKDEPSRKLALARIESTDFTSGQRDEPVRLTGSFQVANQCWCVM